MSEKERVISVYKRMYDGMIAKEESRLRDILDDCEYQFIEKNSNRSFYNVY